VAETAKREKSSWRLTWISLGLGLSFWLLDSTDLSLPGTISDLLFPPFVFFFALVIRIRYRRRLTDREWRISRAAHLPSLLGGGLFCLLGALLLIPPFTLGGIFNAYEIISEKCVQRVVSPDRSRIARVYFRARGSYAGGQGTVHLRVQTRLFPLLERDLYESVVFESDATTKEWIVWQGNDWIYLEEDKESISAGGIRFHLPEVIDYHVRAFTGLLSILKKPVPK